MRTVGIGVAALHPTRSVELVATGEAIVIAKAGKLVTAGDRWPRRSLLFFQKKASRR